MNKLIPDRLISRWIAIVVTVQAGRPKNISPDRFGIFFEDLITRRMGGKVLLRMKSH